MNLNPDYEGYTDFKKWSAESFGIISKKKDAYYNGELKALGVDVRPGIKCLEVGFGNGSFAAWCRLRGVDYYGVELIDELLSAARFHGFNVSPSINHFDLADSSFDLVVAFDVFEHLQRKDLRLMMSMISRCLSSSGKLVFRVPNGDSPFGRLFQHGDLTHETQIGSGIVKQLASIYGFRSYVIKDQFSPVFYDRIFKRSPVKTFKTILKKVRMLVQHFLFLVLGKLILFVFYIGQKDVHLASNIIVCMKK